MTKKIKLLSEKLINKIAAGEVIERPASVLKELLENSIDAKATSIKIEIKGSGKKLIKITDNGEGLSKEDLLLAFERHATSKISDITDLNNITTLGFRGEALPSIASIAKIRAKSKNEESNIGFEIVIEGGSIKNVLETAANRGFTIEVKDIFFNVPARKKFLKSDSVETFVIETIIKKFALCYPSIEITVNHNIKTKVYPKTTNLLKRIEQIYPKNITQSLIPFAIEDDYFSANGYISPPDITSSSSYDINIFLNGRLIKDKTIYYALKDSLKGKIFDKRYPYLFLFINISPDKVDVNVHPSKLEVRFSDEKKIYTLIKNTFDTITTTRANNHSDISDEVKSTENFDKISKIKNFVKSSFEKYNIIAKDRGIEEIDNDEFSLFDTNTTEILPKSNDSFYLSLDFVGTFADTFIILKNNDSLFLLDQHAAHERIQMEKFKIVAAQNNFTKKLLIPEILDLSEHQKKIVEENLKDINLLGFEIDNLDNTTLIVKGIPASLSDFEINDIIENIIEEIKIKTSSTTVEELNNKLIARLACKSAVKAGAKLDENSVKYLLKELDNTPNNSTCPHGRPILIEITKNELFRRFKRTL